MDLKEKFVKEYVFPTIKANGLYQGIYPLTTSVGRPLIAIEAVKIAKKEGITVLAHGCTGKGNDQIRLNITASAYAPEMEVLQPIIEWNMGRDEELKYAKKNAIPILNANKKYSTDENLFGRSAECDILEHPEIEPPEDARAWTIAPEKAPDSPEYVTINFEEGIPVGLNGETMNPLDIMKNLHDLGCKHGVGRIEHMEDRAIGLKSRETYEVPAAIMLIKAHKDLEKMVMTRHEVLFKQQVDAEWVFLAYAGLWVDPLKEDLDAFINRSQENVNGEVRLKLYKGGLQVVGRSSPMSLYDKNLANYNIKTSFNQSYSKGFIELWGLQTRMYNALKRSTKKHEGTKKPLRKTDA